MNVSPSAFKSIHSHDEHILTKTHSLPWNFALLRVIWVFILLKGEEVFKVFFCFVFFRSETEKTFKKITKLANRM